MENVKFRQVTAADAEVAIRSRVQHVSTWKRGDGRASGKNR